MACSPPHTGNYSDSQHWQQTHQDHLGTKFMSTNLLQNARTLTKVAVFWRSTTKCQICQSKNLGHDIIMVEKDAPSIKNVLNRLVVNEEVISQKTKGVLMTAKSKKEFLKSCWTKKNATMLDAGGLGAISEIRGGASSHFLQCHFLLTKICKRGYAIFATHLSS